MEIQFTQGALQVLPFMNVK